MNRSESISNIEALFPIDSEYQDTNEVGKTLLLKAIENIGWRKLSDEILIEYANLCIREDDRQSTKAMKSGLFKF